MGNIKLGVIADDFTGASDAASFLVKAGYRVILLTDIRAVKTLDCDCVVVAQKIRSVAPQRGDSPRCRQLWGCSGRWAWRRYTISIAPPSTLRRREISESSEII